MQDDNGLNFKLLDGKIINISKAGNYNIGFKETIYKLSNLNSKTRKSNKLNETKSSFLISCLDKNFENRKDKNLRCGQQNDFLLKEIYEEIFKRAINPIYIIVLSLISSLIILKSKINFLQNYFKSLLFITGFILILFSELSYKFISSSALVELFFLSLPILFIICFYIYVLFKSNFNVKFL